MSSRVELLPQSNAQTASATDVLDDERRKLEGRGDERAHGVVGADEVVRQVGVEALHPEARAPHATSGLGEFGSHCRVGAAPRVLVVGALQVLGVDEILEAMDTAMTLESAHRVV